MTGLIPAILILLVICNLYALSTTRYAHAIRAIAVQGFLIAALPLPQVLAGSLHAMFLTAGTLAVKAVLLPVLLMRVLQTTDEFKVVQPFLGSVASLLLGFLMLAAAFLAGLIIPLPVHEHDVLMGATGLATLLTGMLLMVNRRKAVSQVIGFLALENGILILSLRISRGLPFVIELAILLDVLLAAMIFGGFIQSIHEIYSHTDVSRMRKLKG